MSPLTAMGSRTNEHLILYPPTCVVGGRNRLDDYRFLGSVPINDESMVHSPPTLSHWIPLERDDTAGLLHLGIRGYYHQFASRHIHSQ